MFIPSWPAPIFVAIQLTHVYFKYSTCQWFSWEKLGHCVLLWIQTFCHRLIAVKKNLLIHLWFYWVYVLLKKHCCHSLREVLFCMCMWLKLKCCFMSTETVGLLGTGAQDSHLNFHTVPELYIYICGFILFYFMCAFISFHSSLSILFL